VRPFAKTAEDGSILGIDLVHLVEVGASDASDRPQRIDYELSPNLDRSSAPSNHLRVPYADLTMQKGRRPRVDTQIGMQVCDVQGRHGDEIQHSHNA
jgi:hypothetical protein